MSQDADRLLTERTFLTAGGTETYLLFLQQFALREFCGFEIFERADELAKLEADYLFPLLETADAHGHGMLLDTLTWRAQPDYLALLGYQPEEIVRINQQAVRGTRATVEAWRSREGRSDEDFPVVVAAEIGPRGDGYQRAASDLRVEAAREYHSSQLQALADVSPDVICALTMTSATETIGISEAARDLDCPLIVSPTVETDGRLPDGSTVGDFIARVDDATGGLPLFYMLNCAHTSHAMPSLTAAGERGEPWLSRFKGFRANASSKSHAELDESPDLDRGDPHALAAELAAMRDAFDLRVLGGCCGTDVEHIQEIARLA